jgi:hypothetical protein
LLVRPGDGPVVLIAHPSESCSGWPPSSE